MSARWIGGLGDRSGSPAQPALRFVERLRTACETLHLIPPSVIRALVLMQVATDVPWEMEAVMALLDQLTEEYGLVATTERDDRYLTIRLSRRNAKKT